MDTDPSEAAEDAVDEERLLEGEAPTSDHTDDAELWISVYSELVAFKEELVTRTETMIGEMLPEAAHEVETTDLTVLQAEHRRLRRRLDFWTHRLEQLTAR